MKPILALFLILSFPSLAYTQETNASKLAILQTPGGVSFGLLGKKGAVPAPTLFVFADDIATTLNEEDFNRMGHLLAEKDWLCVSLDLPCHGQDAAVHGVGLEAWRTRMEKGENFVPEFIAKCSAVLDHLIKEGYTDPKQVAAGGCSRGAFIALHFAAADPRVKRIAGLAPLTNLLAIREFKGMEQNKIAKSLSIIRSAKKLAGRSIWISIGNNDQRVGTDETIAFCRELVKVSLAQNQPADVDLHVTATEGHGTYPSTHDGAAAWLLSRMNPAK